MFARDDATKQVSMLFFLIYYCMSVVFVGMLESKYQKGKKSLSPK